jgi:glycosyltransferase involved in cell wall biosynthesis
MQEHFAYWVSEPDKGIYNAMNKGIDHATGEYLLFLNSGDYFAADDVIENFVGFNPTEDIVYGDILLDYNNGRIEKKEMPDKIDISNALDITITHQAIFHKKTLFSNNNRYNERFKMIADWVFYNTALLINKKSYKKINLIIAVYNMNGYSSGDNAKKQRTEERNRYIKETFGSNFFDLLQSYRKLNTQFNNITNYTLVKISLKTNRILQKLNIHF